MNLATAFLIRLNILIPKDKATDMADLFDDAKLPLQCPKCGHTSQEKVTRLERNPKITCGGCGSVINVKADELRKARREINKAIDDLRKKFR